MFIFEVTFEYFFSYKFLWGKLGSSKKMAQALNQTVM